MKWGAKMLNLEIDIAFRREFGGPIYRLKTKDKFLWIICDNEIIHAQTVYSSNDWGIKGFSEILNNIDEYIAISETYSPK